MKTGSTTFRNMLPKPFLKWAGGKTQLAEEIIRRRPGRFGVYYEPFVGSGAVFFALVRKGLIRHATLADSNWELIETYRAIRDYPDEVMKLLASYPYTADFYYLLREQDPRCLSPAERAARMIYLNKTGYNGLYRVNREGKFNVPFGRYRSPKYYDPDNLQAVAAALQNVELYCEDFSTIVTRAARNDWVYFDPPYVPVSATANFTAYQAGGFGYHEQERLRDICMLLHEKHIFITLSNSDTPLVHQLYANPIFRLVRLYARRSISCNPSRRGPITEVLVLNYTPANQECQPPLISPIAQTITSAETPAKSAHPPVEIAPAVSARCTACSDPEQGRGSL
ncbi:MAG: DNA adenine methylase [Bacteroidota bacterium]|nr:DNA adenine methylase [Candidatus Kapabacteria bacterium]MDW8272313.1 DNA adenine methylase [Bacteroidota bacterium]